MYAESREGRRPVNTELILLWLLCGVILIPALLYFGGRVLADWWFGRVPGGRK